MPINLFPYYKYWGVPFISTVFLFLAHLLTGAASPTGINTLPSYTHHFKGELQVFHVPEPYTLPGKMVMGPDHELWFPLIAYRNFGTDQPSGAIGRMDADGNVRLFPLPTANSYPTEITVGHDGVLWFTVVQGDGDVMRGVDIPPHFAHVSGKIGKLTHTGRFSMFTLPSAHALAKGITAGADGAIWFTEMSTSDESNSFRRIGRLTLWGGFTEFPLKGLDENDTIGPIVAQTDGTLWFSISGVDSHYRAIGKMGRMTTWGELKVFSLGLFTVPRDLAPGPERTVWFITNAMVGYIAADGHVRTFVPPHSSGHSIILGGITRGSDGTMWFATGNAEVGRVTMNGWFTFYPFHDHTDFDNGGGFWTLGRLKGIVGNTDGTLWLSDGMLVGHFV